MKKYVVLRTDLADEQIRQIVSFSAERFGTESALNILDELENAQKLLEANPYIGSVPRYRLLKRQGFRVFVMKKNLVFYKVDEDKSAIIIYAIVDHRQEYLDIVNGLL